MKTIKTICFPLIVGFGMLVIAPYLFAQQPFPGRPAGSPAPSGVGPGPASPPLPFPPPIQPEQLPGRSVKPLAVEKISPDIFKMGEILIYKNTRSITFPANVNMDKGLLEYLLVRSSGKVHESLLRTGIDPYHLQIAFLLLGFEGTDRPLREQGDPEKPRGDPVEIIVEFNPRGQILQVKPEAWVTIKENNNHRETGAMDWVYTGSMVIDGRFLAQMGGSIVAIYHDPGALIDNATAGGESDKIWFVNEGSVPPVGTPVTVIIRAKK
jgi:hypothetical protein